MVDDQQPGAGAPLPTDTQVAAAAAGHATHPAEPHSGGAAGRLNWLRAALDA